jgi:hypothetical protein
MCVSRFLVLQKAVARAVLSSELTTLRTSDDCSKQETTANVNELTRMHIETDQRNELIRRRIGTQR